jgi:hypothetical protein
LIERLKKIGDIIHNYTEKLVFSFADISIYKKVQMNLKKKNVKYIEFTKDKMYETALKISIINKKWNLKIATCAEAIDLSAYGIEHNRCIDDQLLLEAINQNYSSLIRPLFHAPLPT